MLHHPSTCLFRPANHARHSHRPRRTEPPWQHRRNGARYEKMGFTSLHLVHPARFPDPQADWRAAQAVDVVANATVVDSLEDAIGDCAAVLGTSTRARRIAWPRTGAAVAILFGREASGLTNAELQRCNQHIVIPSHPAYPSLNLAMAAQDSRTAEADIQTSPRRRTQLTSL